MVSIRYKDLPEGSHAQVESKGGRPVIYLLPGLSPGQRKDALRRLLRASRLGHGPKLRSSAVAAAAARDSAKGTVRNGMAAVRCHPAGSLFLTALLGSAVVCYMMFISVTIRLIPSPGQHGVPPLLHETNGSQNQASGGHRPARSALPSPPAAMLPASTPVALAHDPSAPGRKPPGPAGDPTPMRTGPSPVSSGRPPRPHPDPSASSPRPPTPRPTGSPGGLCVTVGPLGVCLKL
ncbi:MAG TPA: hypothetical protein VG253_15390 [Streptosporangiaceae bacterium]|jgi:hypothetical protein|nr:hypothetical protein [Streptosporangiaceae bacterium]